VAGARTDFARGANAVLALAASVWLLGAGEAPEYPDDPSAFTTVIDATAYDDRFETVADLLDHVAGVRVRRYGGLGAFSTASVRGAKSEQVMVLLDGVPLNSAYRGGVDLSTLPLRLVQRIEVVRGASARHGSGAVGGVISITTRSAAAVPGWDATGTVGDLETLGADALLSGERGRLSGLLGYDRLGSENEFSFVRSTPEGAAVSAPPLRHRRIGADFLNQTWLGKLELSSGVDESLAATVHFHDADRGQPGSTLLAPNEAPDSQVSCPRASERYRRGVLRLAWTDPTLARGGFGAALYHRFERSGLDDPQVPDPVTGQLVTCGLIVPAARGGRDEVESTEHESGMELTYAPEPRRFGPLELRGRVAGSLRDQTWRGDEADDTGRWIGSLFFQEELSFFESRLRILPAVGFEAARTRETQVRDPGTGAFVDVRPDEDPAWLPRIGIVLRVASGLDLKANYSVGYRRPSFQELFLPDQGYIRGNPYLRPEESRSFDVGLELARRRAGPLEDVRLAVAHFWQDLEDPIEFVQINQATFAPINFPDSRVRGVEVQGSLRLADRLELSASYTHLDSEVDDTGTELPHRPRNRLFAGASVDVGPTRLWAEILHEDEVLLSWVGNLRAEEATQIDVGITLRLAELLPLPRLAQSLALGLEWINVNDEKRVDSLGFPLPGRTWIVRLHGAGR
jgi:iron complex outermembrane receptor protein